MSPHLSFLLRSRIILSTPGNPQKKTVFLNSSRRRLEQFSLFLCLRLLTNENVPPSRSGLFRFFHCQKYLRHIILLNIPNRTVVSTLFLLDDSVDDHNKFSFEFFFFDLFCEFTDCTSVYGLEFFGKLSANHCLRVAHAVFYL